MASQITPEDIWEALKAKKSVVLTLSSPLPIPDIKLALKRIKYREQLRDGEFARFKGWRVKYQEHEAEDGKIKLYVRLASPTEIGAKTKSIGEIEAMEI